MDISEGDYRFAAGGPENNKNAYIDTEKTSVLLVQSVQFVKSIVL